MAKTETTEGTRRPSLSRRLTPGNTIPMAAAKLKLGVGQVRRAVDKQQIKTVEFAGLRRITDLEIERVRAPLEMNS